MPRGFFTVETSLDRYRAIFVDRELPLTIGTSIDRIEHFAFTTLIRIGGCECFETTSNASIFRNRGLNIRLLELRLIIIYVA